MTVEELGIKSYCLNRGQLRIVNGVVYYMDKKHMYPKAPPVGYVALVGLPVLLEFTCCNVEIAMAGAIPSL